MKFRLPVLDPSKAYIGTSLFLPRQFIAEGPVRRALTFAVEAGEEPRQLVVEHPHHLEVPRNYRIKAELLELGLDVIDLRPRVFEKVDLEPIPGFFFRKHQKPAWANMLEALDARTDFVLRLATGRGKTIMGWRFASEIGGPTLIVSAQKAHLRSWEQELERLFVFNGTIGWIADNRLEYDRDIVFCTIQTLVKRLEAGQLPRGFANRFALVIYDEVHHQAAKWFSRGSDLVGGIRMGLTATLKRRDRCEGIITAHLGRVVYDDPEEDTLTPTVEVHETGVSSADDNPEILDCLGQPNVSRMRSFLAGLPDRNRKILSVIRMRLGQGRKVYVLSHSKDHVYELVSMLKAANVSVGIITGDEKDADERLRQLNNYDVVVATLHVGKENYNRPEFSSLVMATPLAVDPYAPTEWAQAAGRILRPVPGKPDPVIDLFADPGVTQAHGMLLSVLRWCNRNDWLVRGDRWTRTRSSKAIQAFRA